MERSKQKIIAAGLMAFSSVAMAAKPGTPTLSDVLEASGISATGYIDTGYSHLSGNGLFTSGTANRVFDTQHNSFNLHMADLTLSSQPTSGAGGLVELSAGSDADVIASTGTGNTDQFDVQQAYVSYAQGAFTALLGKFDTLAGAEVIQAPNDLNYSRSILFGYAIPFTHTGLRTTYALNDSAKFTLGVNNGWDQVKDTNPQKTVELGAALNPTKAVALNASIYSGTENTTPGQGRRDLLDVVATFNATSALSFIANYDYGKQQNALVAGQEAKWSGVAGYVNYSFSPKWRATVRAEYFNDKDGYRTGLVQKWKEATLTVAYIPDPHMELRGEVRGDRSDQAAFVTTDGTAKKTQQSVGVEALYKF